MIRGDRVRERRRTLKMTQEELANAVGIKQGFLSFVEAGKRDVSTDTLVALSRILRTTVGYLVGEEDMDETAERLTAAVACVSLLHDHGGSVLAGTGNTRSKRSMPEKDANVKHSVDAVRRGAAVRGHGLVGLRLAQYGPARPAPGCVRRTWSGTLGRAAPLDDARVLGKGQARRSYPP
jgi:DNA-binding XRE family transcriptional regulator